MELILFQMYKNDNKKKNSRLTNMELSELEGFNEDGERTQSREI